jgi:hypothetical protein
MTTDGEACPATVEHPIHAGVNTLGVTYINLNVLQYVNF